MCHGHQSLSMEHTKHWHLQILYIKFNIYLTENIGPSALQSDKIIVV
jgi:hypothetical protein